MMQNKNAKGSYIRNTFLIAGVIVIIGYGISACTHKKADIPEFEVIGRVKPLSGKEISSSVLGVGFETLDRKMFDPSMCYELLGNLGIKWARCQTGWNRCETIKGQYNFEWLDEVVDNLLAVGIQPWFNVGYGNALYTPGAENNSAVGWVPKNNDEAREGWNNFLHALAIHYKGRVNHFEIWNEPNVKSFWRPGRPTPEEYVAFIKRSSSVIYAAEPDAVIAGGAFAGFPTDFFKQCLALGLSDYVDVISLHPYMVNPDLNYQEQVLQWRKLLGQHPPTTRLWQGEAGVPSTDYSVGAISSFDWNESRQARWLLRRVINDLRVKMEKISWYHTCDQKGYRLAHYPGGKSGAYYGLLRADDYTPKPSYYAYQTMCALFDNQTVVNNSLTISFSSSNKNGNEIEKATFVRNSYPLCAYWFPFDVLDDLETEPVTITLNVTGNFVLQKPVLIDPLTGEVMKLEGENEDGIWQFQSVPLKDYPMIISDMYAFEIIQYKE